MTRRLVNFLTALCVLLCLAVAALWVRSYRRYDQVNWFSADYGTCFASGDGGFAVMLGPNYKGPGAVDWPRGWRYRNYKALGAQGLPGQMDTASHRRLRRIGLAYDANQLITPGGAMPPYYSSHRFYFPHWLVMLLLAAPAAAWAWRRRRTRRMLRANLCPACGYDLRATPDRCPECGVAATGAKADDSQRC